MGGAQNNRLQIAGMISIALLFVLLPGNLFSQSTQKEGNIWYFGANAGLDFNTSPPTNLTNGAMSTIEGCASICNRHGNLLFYTDGIKVWDKTHSVMPNGTGMTGHPSSTQSGIIVPNPDSANIYYVFTTSPYSPFETAYSVVDTNLNFGRGDVRNKNVHLNYQAGEKLTAIKHSNGKDIWVLTHQGSNNTFLAYLVTGAGVNHTAVSSSVGQNQSNIAIGYLKASPDGRRLASAEWASKFLEIFDFNPTTGKVTNGQLLENNVPFYGVEFSPSGRFLYAGAGFGSPRFLLQFDMRPTNLSSIIASRKLISNLSNDIGAMQVGPDGKIYVSISNGSYLGIISKPENQDTSCNFVLNAFNLSPKRSNIGLPTFIQSFFYKPTVNFKFGNPTCGQLTFPFSNIGDTGDILSSRWDFGDGKSDTGKRPMHTYLSHGTYTVTNIVNVGGDKPFTDTFVKTLITLPYPQVKIHKVEESHCLTENRFVYADSTKFLDNSVRKTILWTYTDTNLFQYGAPNVIRRYGKAGTFKIKLTVTSSTNCLDSAVDTVNILPSAYASFTTPGDTCFNSNSLKPVVQTSVNAPGNILSYLWDFGDGTTSTLNTPTKKYTDTGNYKITFIAYEKNGCNDTTTGKFTVYPSPKADFTTADVCDKDTAFFTNTSSISKGLLKYKWVFDNGAVTTGVNANMVYADTGKKTVQLVVTSDFFCSDNIQKTVYIKPNPKAAFTTTNLNCTQKPVSFTDKSTRYGIGITSNQWTFGDGGSASTSGNTQHTYTSLGSKPVKLETYAANGCKDSITLPVYINPIPVANFTPNAPELCLKGNAFTFNNISSVVEGNIKQYTWVVNGVDEATTPNFNRSFVSPSTYPIKLILETDSNCFDSITKSVTVNPQITVDVAVNDTGQCYKWHEFNFINNSKVNGSGNISKYNWLYSDNSTNTNAVPPPKRFASEGKYWAQLVMETDKGCTDSFYSDLSVYFSPVPAYSAVEICLGDSVFFDNTTPDPLDKITRWDWDFGDGGKSTQKSPYRKYKAPGNYNTSLIAKTSDGCSDTLILFFPNLVRPQPTAYFDQELVESYERFTTYQFNSTTTGADKFLWDFGDGTISNLEHPEKIYQDIGQFIARLEVENNWGCNASFQRKLFVVPDMEINIPNAFTPGSRDDLNPVFRIEGVYFTKEFSMEIYNRWGETIYKTTNAGDGWDGKYKGEYVPEGIYTYVIRIMDLKNKVNMYYGSLMLMK